MQYLYLIEIKIYKNYILEILLHVSQWKRLNKADQFGNITQWDKRENIFSFYVTRLQKKEKEKEKKKKRKKSFYFKIYFFYRECVPLWKCVPRM